MYPTPYYILFKMINGKEYTILYHDIVIFVYNEFNDVIMYYYYYIL